MIVLSFCSTTHPLQFSTISCSYRTPKTPLKSTNLPARDRAIDFGKHRGQMLGTLPSTYLKWVSKNLRARDFEEWANLADEVLQDPVYKDRIEWEFAEKLLNGDVLSSPLLQESSHIDAVSGLLEISERFGWDNEDKVGWGKIDFKLLGTSRGGRIPRLHENRSVTEIDREKVLMARALHSNRPRGVRNSSNNNNNMSRKNEVLMARALHSNRPQGVEKNEVGISDEELEERRKERRERVKLRGRSKLQGGMERMAKMGIEGKDKGRLGNSDNFRLKANHEDDDIEEGRMVEVQRRRFPGREGLIKKVLSRKRV